MSDGSECREVRFSGTVQGVGFRATARSLARRYGLSGYVRNLPDGRVELVAEGDKQDINQFLSDLRKEMRGIRDEEHSRSETTGQFGGFEIRH
jgi:acylphosphatase